MIATAATITATPAPMTATPATIPATIATMTATRSHNDYTSDARGVGHDDGNTSNNHRSSRNYESYTSANDGIASNKCGTSSYNASYPPLLWRLRQRRRQLHQLQLQLLQHT